MQPNIILIATPGRGDVTLVNFAYLTDSPNHHSEHATGCSCFKGSPETCRWYFIVGNREWCLLYKTSHVITRPSRAWFMLGFSGAGGQTCMDSILPRKRKKRRNISEIQTYPEEKLLARTSTRILVLVHLSPPTKVHIKWQFRTQNCPSEPTPSLQQLHKPHKRRVS